MAQPGIKVTLAHRLAGFVGAAYLHLVGRTSSVQALDDPAFLAFRRDRKPVVYAFWHNNQVFLAYAHRGEPINVVVSQSKDGEYIAQVMKRMRIGAVRGSSSRGAEGAFRRICALLEAGEQAAFTPDGPRGPVQRVHGGVVAAAQISGAPIVPTAVGARRKIVFNSWDKFFVPLPFGQIVVGHGTPFWVSKDEPDETAAERVRAALNAISSEVNAAAQVAPGFWSSLGGWLLGRAYAALAYVAAPLMLAVFLGKHGRRRTFKNLSERLNPGGIRPAPGRRLWLHAASIGEWQALRPVLDELARDSGLSFVVTVSSPEARDVVTKERPDVAVRMLPLDLPGVIRRWLARVQPAAVVIVETELWPNLISELRRALVPVFIINGRLSARSARRWRFLRPFSNRLLSWISHFLVRTELDGRRFCGIGAPVSRVVVTGNTKVDNLRVMTEAERCERREALFGPGDHGVVLVAGSTWPGEEETILRSLAARGDARLRLVIAPRRAARFEEIVGLMAGIPFTWSLWSKAKAERRWDTDVLLVDTMGDLRDLYGAADLAFVGGSLTDRGGQNPLEPAAAGVPVLFGPDMSNFHEEAEDLKKAGGARQARHAQDLLTDVNELVRNGEIRAMLGDAAARYIRSRQGAARQTADFLRSALLLKNPRG